MPDSGTIKYDKKELKPCIVFQNPYHQFVRTKVYDDMAFTLETQQLSMEDIDLKIKSISKEFNILNLLDIEIMNLSGGQLQKVAIVKSLLSNPNLLVLDESIDMLDPISKDSFVKKLREYSKFNNIIMIYITHDMELALLADNIFLLNNSIIYQEEPMKFFEFKDLDKYNITIPYSYTLHKKLNIKFGTFEEIYGN